MLMCLDCKSTNIVEVEILRAYFREGDYLRLRTITIFENKNSDSPKGFISHSEHSKVITAIGKTPIESINNLAILLKSIMHVELLGKTIEGEV
jgi:hypothetical protein